MNEKLRDLSIGGRAEIVGYDTSERLYRERLLSMGLVRGTVISLVKVAPLGDPVEVEVRGFNLSLRKDEADVLVIRRVK